MLNIVKIITSFFNLISDAKDLKNPDGNIDALKVEKLLDDAIDDAEVIAPKDTVLFEKIKTAVNAAIEVEIEATAKPAGQ